MKKIYTLAAGVMLLALPGMAQSGGPDLFGYTWKDNTATGGPTFNWVNIVGRPGTQQINGLNDDNTVGPFTLPFAFRYYWVDVRRFWIGSNGYLSFETNGQISSSPQVGFPGIPSNTAPNNIVAPMLSDLNFTQNANQPANPARAYYYANADSAIVTFQDVAFWTNDNPTGYQGATTFQVILNRVDKSIKFQYLSQTGSWNSSYNNATNPLVVGIENITGDLGLQVSNNALPTAQSAIQFYYPANSTYQVTDAAPLWANNDRNAGFFMLKSAGGPVEVTAANVGNTNIASNMVVSTTIRKASPTGIPLGAPVFTGTETISSLASGTDTTFTYANLYTPAANAAMGSYIVGTTTTLTGDANPTNNGIQTEMVLIDTTNQQTVKLSYAETAPEGLMGFAGGAVYIKPPFYPFTVLSVEYFIAGIQGATSSDNGYVASLYDDSGVSGGPGATPLFTQTFMPADVILNGLNPVQLPTPVTINSGGLYVSWVADGASQNTYVAVDRTAPFSRQNFEVQAGSFGEFRNNDTEDLAISVTARGGTVTARPELTASAFSLGQAYPQPSGSFARFDYNLVKPANVSLTVRTLTGQTVHQAQLGSQAAGAHQVAVPTAALPSGLYLCTFAVGGKQLTRKLVVQR